MQVISEVVLHMPADGRQVVTDFNTQHVRSVAPGPIPDTISNCGELIAPLANTTSRRALAVIRRSFCR